MAHPPLPGCSIHALAAGPWVGRHNARTTDRNQPPPKQDNHHHRRGTASAVPTKTAPKAPPLCRRPECSRRRNDPPAFLSASYNRRANCHVNQSRLPSSSRTAKNPPEKITPQKPPRISMSSPHPPPKPLKPSSTLAISHQKTWHSYWFHFAKLELERSNQHHNRCKRPNPETKNETCESCNRNKIKQ